MIHPAIHTSQGMFKEFESAGAVCSVEESSVSQNLGGLIALKASKSASKSAGAKGDVPKIYGVGHLLHQSYASTELVTKNCNIYQIQIKIKNIFYNSKIGAFYPTLPIHFLFGAAFILCFHLNENSTQTTCTTCD